MSESRGDSGDEETVGAVQDTGNPRAELTSTKFFCTRVPTVGVQFTAPKGIWQLLSRFGDGGIYRERDETKEITARNAITSSPGVERHDH